MRAAVREEPGATPVVREFDEPSPQDGAVLIDVDTAGLGGMDVLGAYRVDMPYPCVVRGEGVGRTQDGRRVYFGERSVSPFGAWAERTLVPAAEVWEVPDDVDDTTAITMAIAGTGAFLPLQQADIQAGERVLILGGTGAIGQIALQLARHLGAGSVVAAARDRAALDRLVERGIADAVVQLGGDDDAAALAAEAGDGFDVVLDLVFGTPMVAALKATRWNARIVSIGRGAGREVSLELGDLLYRSITCWGTGQYAPEERRRVWETLLMLAREQDITVDQVRYSLDQAADAWQAQLASPHAKITASVST